HAEGLEGAAWRFVGRRTGRDRPVIALDAVHRDGHHLVVLVDGDIDVGLRRGAAQQGQTGESNEERTHVYLWPPGLISKAPRFSVPGMQYARNPGFVPAAQTCIVNRARSFSNARCKLRR